MLFLDSYDGVTFQHFCTRKPFPLSKYSPQNIFPPSHTYSLRRTYTALKLRDWQVGYCATSPDAYTVYLSAFFFPKTIFTLPTMWFNGPKPLFPCIFIGQKSWERALPCTVWPKIRTVARYHGTFFAIGNRSSFHRFLLSLLERYSICKYIVYLLLLLYMQSLLLLYMQVLNLN